MPASGNEHWPICHTARRNAVICICKDLHDACNSVGLEGMPQLVSQQQLPQMWQSIESSVADLHAGHARFAQQSQS
jgi:hypothetical protein